MHLLKLFDLKDNIQPVPWLEAGPLLKPFFSDEEIPHQFFAVDEARCYEGRAAVGRLFRAIYGS